MFVSHTLQQSLDHVFILLPFTTEEELKSNELNRIAAFNRSVMVQLMGVTPERPKLTTQKKIEGRFTLWTVKSDHGRWPLSMIQVHVPTFMVQLHKKLVLRALGPSPSVKRMWTRKNDHAPKNELADF
jgi:hypothetical protein